MAIGDALGITSEGMFVSERNERFGEIRDYIPSRYMEKALGFPSDDTQLNFWTLEQMIADGGFVPDHVAKRFLNDRIFGLGSTVREFLTNYSSGRPWHQSGPASAGNGALMRISPVLIPNLKKGGAALWVDAALCAMMTHNDTVAAIVGAAVGALHGKKAIPKRWIENLSGRTTDRDDGRLQPGSPRGTAGHVRQNQR